MESQNKNKNNGIEVLIVEDSATQAEHLKHLLEKNGYLVRMVTNGKEALSEARQQKPTLVVSDIMMPEMDGYTLCKEIKADKNLKEVPVILLTSLASPQDVIQGLECGANSFIRKPFDEKYLLSRINYTLTNQELRKSEKMQMGVELYLGGQKHFITAERQQILDLLISTYDQAVHINGELKIRQNELERSYQILNGLYRISDGLNEAMSEKEVAEITLERAVELPGVKAGWIFVREGEKNFRMLAVRGLPPALQTPDAFEGDCLCRRKLLEGELVQAANILECERLQKAKGNTQGLHYHASIPLWIEQNTVGLMNLVGVDQGLFSDEDLKILTTVGNQVGIALERARLHQHLEKQVEERTEALKLEMEERKQAQEALLLKEEQLRQIQKIEALGRLAGGIAHDFNNLLTAIIGYSELLMHRLLQQDPLRKEVEEILKAAGRAATLTRQLLTFSRKQEIALEILDLNAVVKEVQTMLQRLIGENIKLATELKPEGACVKSDQGKLEQVIMNLVVNARDAMPEGGEIRIETSTLDLAETCKSKFEDIKPGSYVILKVSDTGTGMDEKVLSHLFEPFFTTKEKEKGTGLGLSTVYGIVKQSNGHITVESELGKGTLFTIYFPLAEEKAAAAPKNHSKKSAKTFPSTETILVVEDEPSLRELAEAILDMKGYHVLSAKDAEEAQQLCGKYKGPLQLLLTDLSLPKMSGQELARKLVAARPEIKVLYMSGYDEGAIAQQNLLEEERPFIQKPFTFASLNQKVREVLDAPQPPQNLRKSA